jgi:acetyl esterase/lipase
MSLTSDLTLNSSKFHPDTVSEDVRKTNAYIQSILPNPPQWQTFGPAKYREMVEAGDIPFPGPEYLPEAKDAKLPSRDAGRDIPIRVYKPDNGEKSSGVFLHIHGGGFILGSHRQ